MSEKQLRQLASELSKLNYVVQRNWVNLPESVEVDGHGDLDLYCSDDDRGAVTSAIRDLPLVDVRSPLDDYYPKEIGLALLEDTEEYNGFKVPNKQAYFNALYYHNAVHKDNDPYHDELRRVFLEMYPPVKCLDDGVGYYI